MLAGDDDRTSTADMATSREGAAERPVAEAHSGEGGTTAELREEPLVALSDLEAFRERWEAIQTGFVDEPRRAVTEADELVAEVVQQLADTFARERSRLEGQWDRGDDVSTEELRRALQRYRSFFNRLLRT